MRKLFVHYCIAFFNFPDLLAVSPDFIWVNFLTLNTIFNVLTSYYGSGCSVCHDVQNYKEKEKRKRKRTVVTGIAQKSNIASFPLWSFKKKWYALINKVKNHIDRKVYNNNLKKQLLIGLLIRMQQDESPLQPCSGMPNILSQWIRFMSLFSCKLPFWL